LGFLNSAKRAFLFFPELKLSLNLKLTLPGPEVKP
jgi:hypothetical protein